MFIQKSLLMSKKQYSSFSSNVRKGFPAYMYVAHTTISIPLSEYSVKNVDLKYMCLDLNVDLSLGCKEQHCYL